MTIKLGNVQLNISKIEGLHEHFNAAIREYASIQDSARLIISNRIRLHYQNLSTDGLSEMIDQAFVKAAADSDFHQLKDKRCLQQMQRMFLANCKTLAKNNFARVIRKHFRRLLKLKQSKCRPLNFLFRLALGWGGQWSSGIVICVSICSILKHSTEDEVDESCEDKPERSYTERSYTLREFHTDLASIKKKTKIEAAVIEELMKFPDIQDLREYFLPPYLMHIYGDEEKGWRAKLAADKDWLMLALRFFAQENNEEFVQQMTPQPNLHARYQEITTTILAAIWCDHLHQNHGILADHFNDPECKYCIVQRFNNNST